MWKEIDSLEHLCLITHKRNTTKTKTTHYFNLLFFELSKQDEHVNLGPEYAAARQKSTFSLYNEKEAFFM